MQGQPGDSSEQHHEPQWTPAGFLVRGVTGRPGRQVPGIIVIASFKNQDAPRPAILIREGVLRLGSISGSCEGGIALCSRSLGIGAGPLKAGEIGHQ